MNNIATLYASKLKKQFKVLYANWEPGSPVQLGDYGTMAGDIFVPLGKLKEDFSEFANDFIKISADDSRNQMEFRSENGVKVALYAKGAISPKGIPLAKATLDISFSEKDAIFFNASGCTTTRISNKAKVGEVLKKLLTADKWEKEYCVVTDLVFAEQAVIAISHSSSANISFEADSPTLEKINLADASIKLNFTAETDIGYKVPAEEGLVLLIGLCKIKNPFLWWGGDFGTRLHKMTGAMKYKIENSKRIKTEDSVEDLFFGQMGMD